MKSSSLSEQIMFTTTRLECQDASSGTGFFYNYIIDDNMNKMNALETVYSEKREEEISYELLSVCSFSGNHDPGRRTGVFCPEQGRLSLGGIKRRAPRLMGLLWGSGRAGYDNHAGQDDRSLPHFCHRFVLILWNAGQVRAFLGSDLPKRQQIPRALAV